MNINTWHIIGGKRYDIKSCGTSIGKQRIYSLTCTENGVVRKVTDKEEIIMLNEHIASSKSPKNCCMPGLLKLRVAV